MTSEYRCKTCKNWDNFYHGCNLYIFETRLDKKKETIHPYMHEDAYNVIEFVGCASHSDAKTMQCTVCGSDDATHPHCDICFGLAMVNHRQEEREKVLEALKKDLQTRFVSSSNQWSKGRNSGLLECCNIIDEELRQEGKDGE